MPNRVITDYIQRERRTYTRDAIREALLRKGYRPDEVEEAFRAVEAGDAPPPAHLTVRGWLLYAAYIGGLYAAVVTLAVVFGHLAIGVAAGVMAIFLVLALPGAALFAAMSRSLALGLASGLAIAALIPFVVIVILGGSCVALLAAVSVGPSGPQEVRTAGTVVADLRPPVEISRADAAAECSHSPISGHLGVSAEIGRIASGTVTVSVDVYGVAAPPADQTANVYVSVRSTQPPGATFAVGPQTDYELTVSPGGFAGTLHFTDLYEVPQDGGDNPSRELSGTISWDCEVS
ncbi:MAG: hypothetical protein M3295_03070 [Chloroflexota bacterium]|nr:hypothetical protein [Chloroflexota bacterium]